MKPILRLAVCFSVAALTFNHVDAQRSTAVFEDGTQIEYEVLSDRPEDISKLNIYWGALASNVIEGIRVQYNFDDLSHITLQTNVFGGILYDGVEDSLYTAGKTPAARSFRLRGSYVFASSEKPKESGITLKSESTGANTITAYQLEYDIPRSYAYAVRGGIGYRNTDLLAFSPWSLTYTEVSLGISRIRTRNIALMTTTGKGKPRKYRGSSQMTLFADALFFLGTEAPQIAVAEQMAAEGFEPTNAGVELGWEGRTTFWGKRDWGFFGSAGFIVTPDRSSMTYGFGLYMGFINDHS